MNGEFQQYRFARIEAQNITRARLEAQFKDGIDGLEDVEKAIEQLLMTEPTVRPGASRKRSGLAPATEREWPHLSSTGRIGDDLRPLLSRSEARRNCCETL